LPSTAFPPEPGSPIPAFEEADVKQALIEAASKVVLLADPSKFDREALVRVAPITAVNTIVTTKGSTAMSWQPFASSASRSSWRRTLRLLQPEPVRIRCPDHLSRTLQAAE
jgi:hypothetical protein